MSKFIVYFRKNNLMLKIFIYGQLIMRNYMIKKSNLERKLFYGKTQMKDKKSEFIIDILHIQMC